MMQNPQYYFGLPGDLIALPRPSRGLPTTTRRGRTIHSLIGDGAAVTVRARQRSAWELTFPWLDEATAGAVLDYTEGIFGEGPFRYIDPMWRNVLPANASVVGRMSGDPKIGPGASWRPGGGDLLVLDPISPTTGPNRTSGIMRWTGITAGDQLVLGKRDEAASTGLAIFDEPNEIPVIPGESCTFSFYAKLASGTGQLLSRITGLSTAGALLTTANGAAITLTASWQLITITANQAALGAGAAYVRPGIYANASSSLIAQIAAPQMEYGVAATAWASGASSPRVLIADDPVVMMEQLGWRTIKLSLREA